jgi:hypothetical protein
MRRNAPFLSFLFLLRRLGFCLELFPPPMRFFKALAFFFFPCFSEFERAMLQLLNHKQRDDAQHDDKNSNRTLHKIPKKIY